MREIDITCRVVELAREELSPERRALMEKAVEATATSYAPYSHFNVGAAILLDNGVTVAGSNQENAAYPSGLCAERTAAFYAHARYPLARFRAIAIAARDGGADAPLVEEPISPCGACRQVLIEYEKLSGAPVEVLLCGRSKVYLLRSVASTLPLAFTEF